MWKAQVGLDDTEKEKPKKQADDDDWETDPDFVNNVSEKQQRFGSVSNPVTLEAKKEPVTDMKTVIPGAIEKHEDHVKKEYESKGTFAQGYGGKYGVQEDRMDKNAQKY